MIRSVSDIKHKFIKQAKINKEEGYDGLDRIEFVMNRGSRAS
jgi:hypothetical protein